MDLTAYLGTVVALCGVAVGAMYAIVGLLGRRIDDLRGDVSTRLRRLESQNDSIIDSVAVLGQRVMRIEERGA